MLRTYQPRKRHRSKVHGFRKRMLPPTAGRFLPAAAPKAELSFPPEQIGKRSRQSVELPLKIRGERIQVCSPRNSYPPP